MYNLVFDTATKWLYIALLKDETILAETKLESEHAHSANFLYLLKTMLRSNDLTLDDIGAIYTGMGPGSYTGVRIALTVAKMFSSFKEIPLYGVSSLYLAGSGYDNKNVAIMFDARRGNFFSSLYGENNIPDKLREKEEFLDSIKDFDDVKIVYEDDFKVNPIKCMKQAYRILNVDEVEPNYLRISEAEYNLLHDKKS